MFSISAPRNVLPRWAFRPPSSKQKIWSTRYRFGIFIAVFVTVALTTFRPVRSHISDALFRHPLTEEDFVSRLYQATIDDYDPSPISAYCAHDNWNASRVINCDRIFGGIGMVWHNGYSNSTN